MRPKISSSTTMSIHQARNGGPTRTSGLVPSSRASVSNFRVPALECLRSIFKCTRILGRSRRSLMTQRSNPPGCTGPRPKSCDHQDVGNPVWGSAILNDASLSSIYNEGKETFMEVVRNKNNSRLVPDTYVYCDPPSRLKTSISNWMEGRWRTCSR